MINLNTKTLKTGHLYFIIIMLVILFQIQTGGAAILDSCSYPASGGDLIDRAFYVPNYTGTNLQQVTLELSSNTAGNFNFSLTAYAGAFNGPLIGTASANVSLTSSYDPVTFDFGSVPVTPGSTVAFIISKTGGPGGLQYFRTFSSFSGDPTCPVIETEDSTPPLSTIRRQGVDIIITGDPGSVSVPTMNEWGMMIFLIPAGFGSVYYLRRQRRA
jgi:hypothetical protein